MAIEEQQSALMSFSSFLSGFLPTARAEEAQPAAEEEEDAPAEESSSKDSEGGEDAGAEEEEPAAEEPEEEEEEEEEPEDIYPAIREECADSRECANLKHHFDHCQEKVQAGKGHKGEDCVEELFHLMHCVDNCAAPKLFSKLV